MTPGSRSRDTLRSLDAEQRLGGGAAIALGLSLFLPWWRDPFIGITAVAVRRLTFIEVAILLVAVSVLVLLAGRARGRSFHLPLSDGTLLTAAGAWATFLVVYRILDPPSRSAERVRDAVEVTRDYGLRWGAGLALGAAVVLAIAGARTRHRHHAGEPESVAADADATPTLPLTR